MLDSLNPKALEIINKLQRYSKSRGIKKVGSEYLILSMYEQKDSLCRFLFNEYKITEQEVIEETNNLIIIRKDEKDFTKALENIFKEAIILAKGKEVSDEHLFMATLKTKDSIACYILEMLGLDIDDLVEDVGEIYDFDKQEEELEYTKNVTTMAKKGELNVFVCRDEYINRMNIILKRKLKNNPLLIGNAGVGKTALIEGLALHNFNNKEDTEIISLNLGSMLAGTKYRGDFEQRLDKVVKEISKKKNIILFIDEIHTIVGAGTTEGSLDVANMLKPFLARSDFKLIGATTPAEYHKSIEKDKALSRRFQTIFIKEPDKEETFKILCGIKDSYEQYHNVKLEDELLTYIVNEASRRIVKRYNPDKSIDVLDEVLATASSVEKKYITANDVDNVIDNILGYKNEMIVENLCYPQLSKYFLLNKAGLLLNKVLLKVNYQGNQIGLDRLINDLEKGFGFTEEMVLKLDLENYNDSHSISSLIGAPPGYVGYEDEGLLSSHILKYPLPVIVINNFNKSNKVIKNMISETMKTGSFNDKAGNTINCMNTIFIICDEVVKYNSVGFLESNPKKLDKQGIFDEYIVGNDTYHNILNSTYMNSLKKYDIEASFDFDIVEDNKQKVNDVVFELIKNHHTGKINFYKDEKDDLRYTTQN